MEGVIYRTAVSLPLDQALSRRLYARSADSNSVADIVVNAGFAVICLVNRYQKRLRFVFVTTRVVIGLFCWLSRLHRLDFAEV
jgi:hypothetical protein